jgi:hypothetical protein
MQKEQLLILIINVLMLKMLCLKNIAQLQVRLDAIKIIPGKLLVWKPQDNRARL